MSLTHQAHAGKTDSERDVRIALLGCGTVGSGVAQLLIDPASNVPLRSGVDFWLAAIAVRSLEKPRAAVIPRHLLTEDAHRLVADPAIDVVIECIGGTGEAAALVVAALTNGKHVVTANKDLLATRGPELRALAAERGVAIAYEAAVGGAIPIVRTISESLAGEEILEVGGVLNGTTNFILSEMADGRSYPSALAEAQRRGFAEADPSGDVEGVDAAHKLAILAQLAFRRGLVTREIPRTGITAVSRDDLVLAKRMGRALKLIACARRDESIVTPAYVALEHPFAQPLGPQNCIRVTGRSAGSLTFAGAGAGGAPTASAVIGDVVAILRRVSAGRHAGVPIASPQLRAVRSDAPEPAIALRRIVRLASLGEVRPACEALGAAAGGAEPVPNVPAVVTRAASRLSAREFAVLLAARGVSALSIIPVWEDLPAVAASPHTAAPAEIIATPA